MAISYLKTERVKQKLKGKIFPKRKSSFLETDRYGYPNTDEVVYILGTDI